MKRILLLSMMLWLSASALKALQTMASPHSATSGDTVVPVTLGQSVVALNGPWKFHTGDDPRWAAPDFNDSAWEQHVLALGVQSLTPDRVVSMQPLPGWQGHGHPGYAGYGWYRIQLMIAADAMPVALLMPAAVDNSYEVYLNGRLIGKLGRLDGFQLSYLPHPQFISIPADSAESASRIRSRFDSGASRGRLSRGGRKSTGDFALCPCSALLNWLRYLVKAFLREIRRTGVKVVLGFYCSLGTVLSA